MYESAECKNVTYLGDCLAALNRFTPISGTIAALNFGAVGNVESAINAVEQTIAVIPEPTERDAARDFLVIGQDKLQAYRDEMTTYTAAQRRAAIARRVFETYGTSITGSLETIYKDVEAEFREFYRAINSDDEGAFEAQLTPSIGKLGFEVNFYGRGFFPPGAYHSEGHQDGMGLCLYLALMKHLLGDGFTFAVLDDVLMSVDTGHRREVCALLKSKFPDTQFVLTTHDGVWLRHMKTVGLIEGKAGIEFRKWDVDRGPSEWRDVNVWSEIDGLVAKGDVRGAAGLLRHNLEHLAAEYCARLGARVEYKEDGRYELGDLLPSAIVAMRQALKEAKAAANSWGNQDNLAAVTKLEDKFSAAATAALAEQWQINPAVHYNEWANFSKDDFAPVVSSFKSLAEHFRCTKCSGLLYLIKVNHKKNTIRCDCSNIQISLTQKGT